MLWPDSRVKDRKPGNDHHRSVITIEEIEPTPETPVVPLLCPRGWSEYPNASMVPGSWETKRMQQGKQHILCARPAPITQPIPCGRCEQRNIRTQQCERFIECHNGLLLDNECLCPKGTHPKATTCGYACKQITCPSGLYWNGRQCAKPIRACGKCEQRNPITRQCVRHIECNNGNLKRGRCYCPKGTRAKTTACGYTCAKIRCPSGQRWNGKLCVCPRGLIKKWRQSEEYWQVGNASKNHVVSVNSATQKPCSVNASLNAMAANSEGASAIVQKGLNPGVPVAVLPAKRSAVVVAVTGLVTPAHVAKD